jgi:hypothetical protein
MSLVFLRTEDGRFLATGAEPDASLRVVSEPEDYFESDGTKLKSLLTGRYLEASIEPDAVVLRSAEEGFPTRFTAETIDTDSHGCCGPRYTADDGRVEPAYKAFAHKEALEWAGKLLRKGLTPEADVFQTFWIHESFQKAVKQGLYDADFAFPYQGTKHVFGLIHSFENHFYDPLTGGNFYKDQGNDWHALCDGRRYFNLAVHTGRRLKKLSSIPDDLLTQTGYYLGLSVHFLSDLTQPMHAANFANVYGAHEDRHDYKSDKRHEGFEIAADTWVKDKYAVHYANGLTPNDVDISGITDAGQFLVNTAHAHRQIYTSKVARIAASKKKPYPYEPGHVFENEWKIAEAAPALELSLLFTPKVLARYFAFWASRISRDETITHKRWYQIRAFFGDKPLRLQDGEIQVGEAGDVSVQTQFCFVFNPNGTWTVVSRSNLSLSWHMSTPGLGAWLVAYHGENGLPPKHSEFRFVPYGPGRESDFWIFERTYDDRNKTGGDPEVIGLENKTGPKIKRDRPTYDAYQLFHVVPMEEIHPTVQERLPGIWHDYGKHEWWGRKG